MLHTFLYGLKKLFRLGKTIILLLIVYLLIINIFSRSINNNGQKNVYDPVKTNRENIYKVLNSSKLNSSKESKLELSLYRLLMCSSIGEACTDNPQDGNENYKKSIFGSVGNLMAMTYSNLPASGVYWAYSGLQNTGFVPKTMAAGVGFNSLHAFISVWDAFRKLSYLILVLVIVSLGFMIMFRMKLNPQTVISVENALPRIVITLILITFSFAIVGFLIDIMYLIIILGINIIGTAFKINVPGFQNNILSSNLFDYIFTWDTLELYWNAVNSIIGILPWELQTLIQTILSIVGLAMVLRLGTTLSDSFAKILGDLSADFGWNAIIKGTATLNIGKIIGFLVGFGISFVAAGFLLRGLIFGALAIFTILFLAFRIFFLLLSSLIQVILYLIFAPIFLLMEAVPGRSSFSGWLKNIIGNLIAFPAVIFLILITNGITTVITNGSATSFTPPFLNGINSQALIPLIDGVLLLMIPDLVKTLKQSVIGKEGLNIPVSPGTLFGAGAAAGGTVMGGLNQLYYAKMGIGALIGQDGKEGLVSGVLNIFGKKKT